MIILTTSKRKFSKKNNDFSLKQKVLKLWKVEINNNNDDKILSLVLKNNNNNTKNITKLRKQLVIFGMIRNFDQKKNVLMLLLIHHVRSRDDRFRIETKNRMIE
jgi:hypothetical protein